MGTTEIEAKDVTPDDAPVAPLTVFSGPFRLTTAGLLIVVTMIAFEAMAVTTAMPSAARELDGLAYYGWAFSGFMVANIIGIVGAGVLCGLRGPKPSLWLGLAAFLAGLVLAGAATSMTQLIAGRVVQGLGAGTLITVMYVVIGESYPDALRPKVFAYISSAWVLPGFAGPPLSGLITEHLGWRWVFLTLIPIAAVSALLVLPQSRSMSAQRRVDAPEGGRARLVRAVLVAGGVAVLLQAGQHLSLLWLAPALVALALIGWALLGLVPRGTFRFEPGVPTTIALRGLLAGALFSVDALIPLVMTVQHGWSPATAGLPLVGSAVTWALGSWWQGREQMDGRRPALVRAGFVSLAIGLTGAAVASLPSSPAWFMYIAWIFAGLGAGLTMSSVGVLMLAQTTDAHRARDSAALQLFDNVVTVLTTGVAGVLVAAAVHARISYTSAFVIQDLAMIALALTGVVFAGRVIRRERPRSTRAEQDPASRTGSAG